MDMTVILAIIFGLLGVAIGSFLNVCIDRLPARKSLAYPASHCDACQHPLSPLDNIPVISYLWLRGKCRYCQASIPRRVVLVEIFTGALFTLLYLKYGLSAQFAVTIIYSCILLVLAVIDLENGLLLNVIVYPTMVLALGASIFLPETVVNGYAPHIGILNGLMAGAIGFVILLIPAIVSRSGMGWGDVKMAGMLGLMTGFPNVFVAILGGIILGGLWAIGLIVLKKKKRKDAIPFGPFLALGGMIALVWGTAIIHWYTRFF
ncbi:MAG: prepilin peptidase [Dehalococcoidales bacterium]|nr:prepilin peptidase [Dehalococcoidales bacterium]